MSVRLNTQETLRLTVQKTHRALAIQNLEAGLQVTDLPVWHRCFEQLKYAGILMNCRLSPCMYLAFAQYT